MRQDVCVCLQRGVHLRGGSDKTQSAFVEQEENVSECRDGNDEALLAKREE